MNTTVIFVIVFVIGLDVGLLVAFFIMKKVAKRYTITPK